VVKIKSKLSFFTNTSVGLISIGGLLLFAMLYFFNLGNLTSIDSGSARPEGISRSSLSLIASDILFAPHKILNLLVSTAPDFLGMNRLMVSISITLVAVLAFYLVIKEWVTKRIALLSTALFASSSWIIHQARSYEPNAMYLLVIPAVLLAGSMLKIKENDKWLPITTLLIMACLFVPGVWIIILPGLLFISKDLFEAWRMSGWKFRLIWLTSAFIPAAILAYGLTKPGIFNSWIGLSQSFNFNIFLNNIADLPQQLFINGISNPVLWTVGTPILDIASTVFITLGIFQCVKSKSHPVRRWVLIALLILSVVLIGVMGSIAISLLLPLLYVFVALGMTLLLQQWFHVFPINPVARNAGIILIIIVSFIIGSYHIARYHYVWQLSHGTKQVFKQ
jgi:hypothetical protein